MPLEGLRAWIGEVERKLGMRTRVFLVLATIAIGGAGAAIYLALDTRDDAVSESDVRALQERLEEQTVGGAGSGLAQLEAEVNALEAQVEQLRGKSGAGKGGGAGSGGAGAGTGGASNGTGGAAVTPGEASDGGATAGGDGIDKARLRDLLEQAKEQNEKAEENK